MFKVSIHRQPTVWSNVYLSFLTKDVRDWHLKNLVFDDYCSLKIRSYSPFINLAIPYLNYSILYLWSAPVIAFTTVQLRIFFHILLPLVQLAKNMTIPRISFWMYAKATDESPILSPTSIMSPINEKRKYVDICTTFFLNHPRTTHSNNEFKMRITWQRVSPADKLDSRPDRIWSKCGTSFSEHFAIPSETVH